MLLSLRKVEPFVEDCAGKENIKDMNKNDHEYLLMFHNVKKSKGIKLQGQVDELRESLLGRKACQVTSEGLSFNEKKLTTSFPYPG
ncbi:hypothetical protein TNCT_713321 [Trichonephila clavata]|uniref:Uncharacterized protein n=1 Tax=Trichonephila clavata TaxID=2740835 RepID=A0A8X6KVW5_TRICU|nr:hypothetical protein TNCT_713321 [Trichonephila clavata]